MEEYRITYYLHKKEHSLVVQAASMYAALDYAEKKIPGDSVITDIVVLKKND